MSFSKENNRRRILSGICLVGLGFIFLTNPLTNVLHRGGNDTAIRIASRGFAAPLTMALMVGAIFAITQVLRTAADRTGLTGGALVVMGWAVGIRIIGLGQMESLLPTGVLEKAFESAPIVFLSIVPLGLLFPIGLITLGAAIAATRPIHAAAGAALATGGVLFPVGRIGHFAWAFTSSDLLLGASFAFIGWQVLRRPELWAAEETLVSEEARASA